MSPYLLILFLTRLCASQDDGNPEFLLEAQRRTVLSNFVQLRCVTDTLQGIASTDAVFFLNGTSLEDLGITMPLSDDDGILILLTRETEGVYSCALPFDPRTSNTITLVALPNIQVPSFPRTFFAEVDSTAMLTCSITPGRLLRQYFVRWQNGSSGATYRDIPPIGLPTPPTATPPDPRYSIDPVTFSLTITDVQLSDSDSSYRCVLGVVDPRSNRVFTYERTENTDLQLIVFKPPRIIEPPMPATVSLADTRQVLFNCTALGDPAPQITWRHNGGDTTSLLMYHVNQFTPTRDSQGRGFISQGTLGIFPLEEEDSGNVECIASVVASDETTGGQEVPQDTEFAQLAILGGFQNLEVLITQEGDVIYKLRLRGAINTPVSLFFIYTRVGEEAAGDVGGSSVINRTALTTFNGTDSITHIEFNSQVPFQRFRVGVALMNGFTRGPINQTVEEFDVSEPSLVEFRTMKVAVILAGSVPVAIFLLFTITAVVISCVVAVYKHKKAEIRFKDKVAQRDRDVIDILSKRVPKSRYPEFLKFAEKIMLGSCEVCRNSLSEKVGEDHVDGEHGIDLTQVVNSQETSNVTAQMLETTTVILQSSLDNPKISGKLSSNMVAMLAARGVPGVSVPPVAVRGANIGAVNPMAIGGACDGDAVPSNSPCVDLGYSGSSSGSRSAHEHSESDV